MNPNCNAQSSTALLASSGGSRPLNLGGQGDQDGGPTLKNTRKTTAEKDTTNEKKKARPVNYKRKAETKVNLGHSTMTDARFWSRKVDLDLNETDPEKRRALLGSIAMRDDAR